MTPGRGAPRNIEAVAAAERRVSMRLNRSAVAAAAAAAAGGIPGSAGGGGTTTTGVGGVSSSEISNAKQTK